MITTAIDNRTDLTVLQAGVHRDVLSYKMVFIFKYYKNQNMRGRRRKAPSGR